MPHDNSARRLHELLTKALEITVKDSNVANQASIQVWAKVFGVKPSDKDIILSYAEELQSLIKYTRNEINRLQLVRHDPYVRPLDHISSAFCQFGFLCSPWKNLYNQLNDVSMMALLEAAANAIDNEAQLEELSQDQLSQLLETAEALLSDICNSDLDKDLKSFLMVRLEEICIAIRRYSLRGSEGLRIVVESGVGSFLMKASKLTPEEQKQPLFKRSIEFLLKFGGMLGLARNVDQFLLPEFTKIINNLPPGS